MFCTMSQHFYASLAYILNNLRDTVSDTDTCNDDLACITMASHDRLGLEAIRSLHSQLDDDANGNIDLSESDDVRILVSL